MISFDNDGSPLRIIGTHSDIDTRKQTEEKLKTSEKRYQSIVDTQKEMICRFKPDTTLVFVNQAYCKMMGLSESELIGRKYIDFIPAEEHLKVAAHLEKVGNNLEPISYEHRVITIKGETVWHEWTDYPTIVENGVVSEFQSVGNDITEKKKTNELIVAANKKLDESNRMLQTIFDIIPGRLFWKDKDLKYIGANKNFLNDAGLKHISELVGKTDYELHWKENAQQYQKDDAYVIKTDTSKIGYEEQLCVADGTNLWLQTSKIPLKDEKGQTIGVFGAYEDITNRKLTELAFQANERFLRKLLLLINDSLQINNQQQLFLTLSKKIKGLFEADNCFVTQWDEEKQQTIPLYADDESLNYANKTGNETEKTLTQSLIEEGQIITVNNAFDSPYLSKSIAQEFESKSLIGIPLVNEEKKFGALIVGFNNHRTFNISDVERANLTAGIINVLLTRNQFMTDLEYSEKMTRSFIQNSPIGILAFDQKGSFNNSNEAALKMFGFPESELMLRTVFELAHPASVKKILEFMQALLEKGSAKADIRMKHHQNTDFWCAAYGVRLNRDLYVAFFVDVTDRVVAKNELEHERALLRGLLNSIPDVVFYKDLEGKYIGGNPLFSKVTGYTAEEYIGKTSEDLFEMNLATELTKNDQEVITEKSEVVDISYLKDKDGKTIPLEITKAPFYSTNGELIGLLGIARDITDRIEKEEALKKGAEFLEDVTKHAPGVLFQYQIDLDGNRKFTYVSAGVENLFGLTPKQVVEYPDLVFEIIHPEDLSGLSDSITNAYKHLTPWQYDFRIQRDPENVEWVSGTALPKESEDGKVTGYGYLKNVTQEKDYQKRLEESDKRFNLALRFADSGLYDWDMKTNEVFYTDSWKIMLGYDESAAFTTIEDWRNLMHPEDVPNIEKAMIGYMEGHTDIFEFEYRLKTFSGSWKWVLTRGVLIKDENNEPLRWIGTDIDISRLKNLEFDLVFRSALQNLLMTMAGKLINLPLDQHPQAINEILGEVGKLVKADRSYIFSLNEANNTASNTYEWCAEGIEPQIEYLQENSVDDLKDWMTAFDRGESYIIDDVFGLPDDDPAKILLAPQGIKSILSVPMLFDNKKIGFIGFDAVVTQKNWSAIEKELLHFFAEILVSMEVRRNNELALIESENMMSMAAEAARTAIWKWDLEANIIKYNNQMSVMLGFTDENISEKPDAYFNLIHIDDFNDVLIKINDCLTSKSSNFELEYRIHQLNGEIIWIHDKGIVVQQTAEGAPKHLIGTRTDITSRKKFELELKDSEQRFRSIYNNSSIGLYRTTPEGQILMVNPALAEILGYDNVDQLEGLNFEHEKMIFTEERKRFLDLIKANGEIKGFETVWLKKNGEKVDVRENAVAIKDNNDEILYFDGSVEDITTRNIQKKALKESEEKFRQLAENVGDAFWLLSADSKVVLYTNPAVYKLLGIDSEKDDLDFLIATSMIHEADVEMIRQYYRSFLLEESAVFDHQFRIVKPNGEIRWVRARSTKIKNAFGDTERVVGIGTDITQQKELELQMAQTIELEKQLGELKTRFVSMASHELRTPLATIMATIETLKAYWPKMNASEIEKRLDKIGIQGEHLRRIMNDVLDYSKVAAGKTIFEPVMSEFNSLINEITDEFKALPMFAHKLSINLGQPQLFFKFDPKMMRQIISNLLSNAFKYTEEGGNVAISYKVQQNNVLHIEISDEGIGIPEKDIPHLFTPFFRASNSSFSPGTGLGLAIVKEAVENHQGTIVAEKNLPKGTKFIIQIPLTKNEKTN